MTETLYAVCIRDGCLCEANGHDVKRLTMDMRRLTDGDPDGWGWSIGVVVGPERIS